MELSLDVHVGLHEVAHDCLIRAALEDKGLSAHETCPMEGYQSRLFMHAHPVHHQETPGQYDDQSRGPLD